MERNGMKRIRKWTGRVCGMLLSLFVAGGLHAAVPDSAEVRHPLTHSLGVDLRPAYILPSNPSIGGGDGYGMGIRRAASFHLKYGFRLHPASRLGQAYPHTVQGIGVSYNLFGAPHALGNPWAAYLFQRSRIAGIGHYLSFDYEWNFGASFGWHPYDRLLNPRNTTIGSKINAYLNLGFFLNARLSPVWRLLAGVDLTHYSNGNTHIPNAGLNTVGGRIGLVYIFSPLPDKTPLRPVSTPTPVRERFGDRMSYDVILYAATRAKGVLLNREAYILPGKFGILGVQFTPMYRFSRRLRAGISLDGQYDETANIYSDELHAVGEEPQFYRPPLREQIGIGLSARGEFTMPFFAINVGIGHNLYSTKGDLRGVYQVVALKVAVARHLFLHVGYQLQKFHEPNNLMLGLGYRFHGGFAGW